MAYSPILCGNCPWMRKTRKQPDGHKAKCGIMDIPVYRYDFCHRPEGQKRHEEAKAVYEEVQNRSTTMQPRFHIRPMDETGCEE